MSDTPHPAPAGDLVPGTHCDRCGERREFHATTTLHFWYCPKCDVVRSGSFSYVQVAGSLSSGETPAKMWACSCGSRYAQVADACTVCGRARPSGETPAELTPAPLSTSGRELVEEIGRLRDYAFLLERGLGAHEARETIWGNESDPAAPPATEPGDALPNAGDGLTPEMCRRELLRYFDAYCGLHGRPETWTLRSEIFELVCGRASRAGGTAV